MADSMQKADNGEEADSATPPPLMVSGWSRNITSVNDLEELAHELFDKVLACTALSQRGFSHMALISQQLSTFLKEGIEFDLVDAFKGEVASAKVSSWG